MTETRKKLVLPGGSGFCGEVLSHWFAGKGWDVVVLSRGSNGNAAGQFSVSEESNIRFLHWDGETPGEWVTEFDGADAVVNLAGRSVDCRYNDKNRRLIHDSRINSTRVVGNAIAKCNNPPKIWINSSTATIYRDARDHAQSEASGEIGSGFSVDIAKAWEKAFFSSEIPSNVRRVAARCSMVMGTRRKTVFDVLRKLVLMGLGGRMGSGRQMVAWIHEHDYARAIEFLVNNDQIDGAVNVSAPEGISNRDMMRVMRREFHVPIGLPATEWMLEVGAFAMRTETELILKSRWIEPARLLEAGFRFEYPNFESAVAELHSRLR
jgi:uncharacterized protein (TIGR01777 family)